MSIILLLQSGKVGSTAIFRAVKDSFGEGHVQVPGNRIVYSHSMTASQPYAGRHWTSPGLELVRRTLDEITAGAPVKVVTPIRDPASANVSNFFQNLDAHGLSPSSPLEDAVRAFEEEYDHAGLPRA